jgi:hypothetical protein
MENVKRNANALPSGWTSARWLAATGMRLSMATACAFAADGRALSESEVPRWHVPVSIPEMLYQPFSDISFRLG